MQEQPTTEEQPKPARRVITIDLEEQGIERPEPVEEKLDPGALYRPSWMKPTSPYLFKDRQGHKKRYRRAKLDRGLVKDVQGWIYAYKVDHGCCVCGEREPHCLHFHHRYGVKEFIISRNGGRELGAVKEEVAKCDLLCANCHAKVHAGLLVRQLNRKESSL
jgi:hypothetical protein